MVEELQRPSDVKHLNRRDKCFNQPKVVAITLPMISAQIQVFNALPGGKVEEHAETNYLSGSTAMIMTLHSNCLKRRTYMLDCTLDDYFKTLECSGDRYQRAGRREDLAGRVATPR